MAVLSRPAGMGIDARPAVATAYVSGLRRLVPDCAAAAVASSCFRSASLSAGVSTLSVRPAGVIPTAGYEPGVAGRPSTTKGCGGGISPEIRPNILAFDFGGGGFSSMQP